MKKTSCILLEDMATISEKLWHGCQTGLLIFVKLCLVREATWSKCLVAHNQQPVRTKYWSYLVFANPLILSAEVFLNLKAAHFPLCLNVSRDGAACFWQRCCRCEHEQRIFSSVDFKRSVRWVGWKGCMLWAFKYQTGKISLFMC